MVEDIVKAAEGERGGQAVLGAHAVVSKNRRSRGAAPRPPWYEERRAFIIWDNRRDNTQLKLVDVWS